MKIQFLLCAAVLLSCSTQEKTYDRAAIKAEIERLLEIQESTYGDKSPEARQKLAATCSDSLVYIGGDNGGMATSAADYVVDLADGYAIKPYEKFFRIYDNSVIVTAKLQAYKILANDTLRLNYRTTKIFVRIGTEWKMAYFTHAALPIVYTKPVKVDPKILSNYVGVYELEGNMTDSVTVSDGKLYSTPTGGGPSELIPINDSTFIGDGYFGKAVFSKNKKGKVTHYYFEWTDGQRIVFRRIDKN